MEGQELDTTTLLAGYYWADWLQMTSNGSARIQDVLASHIVYLDLFQWLTSLYNILFLFTFCTMVDEANHAGVYAANLFKCLNIHSYSPTMLKNTHVLIG